MPTQAGQKHYTYLPCPQLVAAPHSHHAQDSTAEGRVHGQGSPTTPSWGMTVLQKQRTLNYMATSSSYSSVGLCTVAEHQVHWDRTDQYTSILAGEKWKAGEPAGTGSTGMPWDRAAPPAPRPWGASWWAHCHCSTLFFLWRKAHACL